MKRILAFVVVTLLLCPALAEAQETSHHDDFYALEADTIRQSTDYSVADGMVLKPAFSPDPNKALLWSIIPGGGQIYNHKYWKIPIVYGGLMGCAYAITWNGRQMTDYSSAYYDLVTGEGDSWIDILPLGTNPESIDKAWLTEVCQQRRDTYRRYRDLSIICTGLVYLLGFVDAYVDAELFEFDISPDLSMTVTPTEIPPTQGTSRSYGVHCHISF